MATKLIKGSKMNKTLQLLSLCAVLGGCAAPSVITGNSRSVVINDGQYLAHAYSVGATDATEAAAKAEADKWCAKYGRVSGAEIPHFPPGRRREFECVAK